jgi:hypothetical protein
MWIWMTAALVACGGACAGGEPGPTPTGDRLFVADPAMIQIGPGETASARFVLTSGGVPIGAQTVNFEIVDDPEMPGDEAKGAVLGSMTAVTDGDGAAIVDVTAGEETVFHVLATAGGVPAELVIIVAPATGTVMVAPFFTANSNASGRTTSIEVLLIDNRPCAALDLNGRLRPSRDPVALPSSGGTARFDLVSTTGSNAIVGRALGGHGGAIATGCVDLLGSSLVPNGVVQVAVPLRDATPDPVGTYTLAWPLRFVPPLAAAAVIAEPWRDLGDCPLDPAQLFLDCTIDALSPATDLDPLDCKPSAVAGGEGTLGNALAARRGAMIVDFSGAVTGCRGARDGSGTPSLDAIAMGLFGSPTPALVVALPAIGADAAHALDGADMTSSLDVRPSGRADEYVVTHVLTSARFGSATVTLATLALPALTAYTTAITRDGLLIIDDHGFSLRLGRVARAGFGLTALAPRLPEAKTPDAGGLVSALLDLLRTSDGSGGCAALDRVLCADVGRPPECLGAACPAGLSALVAKLHGAFDAADGTELDLYLAGSAALIDMRGDGMTHQLGSSTSDPTAIASWSVDLSTARGPARLTASFTGTRTGN